MTEIVRFQPTDQREPWAVRLNGEFESRTLGEIELGLAQKGIRFDFQEHFRGLASRFPDSSALLVLEGGCGYGLALQGFKRLETKIGKPITTTGITLAERHIPKNPDCGIDRLIIGPIQTCWEKGLFVQGYHFILDLCGAAYYDRQTSVEIQGQSVIPIYSRLLLHGASALIFLDSIEKPINHVTQMRALLEICQLQIVFTAGKFVLVEKQ